MRQPFSASFSNAKSYYFARSGAYEYAFYPNLLANLLTIDINQFERYNDNYIGDGINFKKARNICLFSMTDSLTTYRLHYSVSISGETKSSQNVLFNNVLLRSEETAQLNTNIYFDEPGGCVESIYNSCGIKVCFCGENTYSDTIVPESYTGNCGNTNCLADYYPNCNFE